MSGMTIRLAGAERPGPTERNDQEQDPGSRFITGHADVPTSVRAMKAGAVEFLTKPFDDEDLLEAIRHAIEHDRTAREQHRNHQAELAAAARIQQGLMTMTALQPPFAEALGKSQPCREIGGDFFSMLTLESAG
jgi:DNA-binding NarL/FixJ family response regulator